MEFFSYFILALLPQNRWNTSTPEARKIPERYYLSWTKISTDIFSRTCNLSTISEGEIIKSSNFHVPKGTTRAISPYLSYAAGSPVPNPVPSLDLGLTRFPGRPWTWLLTLPDLMIIGGQQGPAPVLSPPSMEGLRSSESCPASSAVPTAPGSFSPMGSPTSVGQPPMGHWKFLLKHHFLFWFLLSSLTMEVSSRWLILTSIHLALSHPDWHTLLIMQHKSDFPVISNRGFNLCLGRSNRSYSLDTHTAEVCNDILRNVEYSTKKIDKVEGNTVIQMMKDE